MFNDHVIAN